MSAGHRHFEVRREYKPDEVAHILAQPNTARYLSLPFAIDDTYDIATLAGYSMDGRTIYLDRDFCKWLRSGKVKCAGMSEEDIRQALATHEHTEKALLDADNNIDDYLEAHSIAQAAEDNFVKSKIGNPALYEDALKEAIAFCWRKPLKQNPKELDCEPLVDDPDARSNAVLKELRKAGVRDAFKRSKRSVNYRDGDEQHQCGMCSMYTGDDRGGECTIVAGQVWVARVCDRFHLARLKLRARELLSRGAVSQRSLDKVRSP